MDNPFLSECRSLVEDRTFRLTAEKLALKCGVHANLKGFPRLVDAVILYGSGYFDSFGALFTQIGLLRDKKPKSVMREVSYAIMQAFDIEKHLSSLLGANVPKNDIHSGLVIAYLGSLFRHPDASIYK